MRGQSTEEGGKAGGEREVLERGEGARGRGWGEKGQGEEREGMGGLG